ncbi:MAG: hypothetical protein HW396_1389 [Candidatus Dadabacteria bacterium]|nr:hypothetical protein [Candidatus Dadabacteria bacterium]
MNREVAKGQTLKFQTKKNVRKFVAIGKVLI